MSSTSSLAAVPPFRLHLQSRRKADVVPDELCPQESRRHRALHLVTRNSPSPFLELERYVTLQPATDAKLFYSFFGGLHPTNTRSLPFLPSVYSSPALGGGRWRAALRRYRTCCISRRAGVRSPGYGWVSSCGGGGDGWMVEAGAHLARSCCGVDAGGWQEDPESRSIWRCALQMRRVNAWGCAYSAYSLSSGDGADAGCAPAADNSSVRSSTGTPRGMSTVTLTAPASDVFGSARGRRDELAHAEGSRAEASAISVAYGLEAAAPWFSVGPARYVVNL
ncbi:hypothetical protein C8R45DRAFT_1131244 [Mycena sanguinolenta]|nr:hypothetical protein C8R45DRAFT_1131244 [Mycena sanguinolenta]